MAFAREGIVMWWVVYVIVFLVFMTLFMNSGRISRAEEEREKEK